MKRIDQITVIGTGLLGTSLGLALKQRGRDTGERVPRIIGVGRRQGTADRAKAMDGVDAATTDLAAALAKSDLAVVAAPVGQFVEIFKQIAKCTHDGLIVTDVGSTKQAVLAAAQTHLRQPQFFVGAHPMAGSEKDGPEAASADLFKGKPCVLTPEATTDEQATACVEALWEAVGMRVLRMSAVDHDRQVAAVSHVPHVVAGLLMELAGQRGGREIASTGFADATRLAGGHVGMWTDILMTNRQAVAEALRSFGQRAGELADMIDTGDAEAIQSWLTQQKHERAQWEKRCSFR